MIGAGTIFLDVVVWRVVLSAGRNAGVPDRASPTLFRLQGHQGSIHRVAWSEDGRLLASASDDRSLCVWDVPGIGDVTVPRDPDTPATILPPRLRLYGHAGRLWDACFLPGQTLVISASEDCSARIWSLESGELCGVLRGHAGRGIWHCALVGPRPRRFLATGGADGAVLTWHLPDAAGSAWRPADAAWRQELACQLPAGEDAGSGWVLRNGAPASGKTGSTGVSDSRGEYVRCLAWLRSGGDLTRGDGQRQVPNIESGHDCGAHAKALSTDPCNPSVEPLLVATNRGLLYRLDANAGWELLWKSPRARPLLDLAVTELHAPSGQMCHLLAITELTGRVVVLMLADQNVAIPLADWMPTLEPAAASLACFWAGHASRLVVAGADGTLSLHAIDVPHSDAMISHDPPHLICRWQSPFAKRVTAMSLEVARPDQGPGSDQASTHSGTGAMPRGLVAGDKDGNLAAWSVDEASSGTEACVKLLAASGRLHGGRPIAEVRVLTPSASGSAASGAFQVLSTGADGHRRLWTVAQGSFSPDRCARLCW